MKKMNSLDDSITFLTSILNNNECTEGENIENILRMHTFGGHIENQLFSLFPVDSGAFSFPFQESEGQYSNKQEEASMFDMPKKDVKHSIEKQLIKCENEEESSPVSMFGTSIRCAQRNESTKLIDIKEVECKKGESHSLFSFKGCSQELLETSKDGWRDSEDKTRSFISPGVKKKRLTKQKIKREKNKLSARESRKRKKEYIDSLEKEIDELKEENQRLRDSLTEERSKKKDADTSKASLMSQYLSIRTNLIKSLQQVINQRNEQDKTRLLMEDFKTKMTELFEQRRLELREHFNKIVEIALPEFTKTVLWACFEKKGLFSVQTSEKERRDDRPLLQKAVQSDIQELRSLIDLTNEQLLSIQGQTAKVRFESSRVKEALTDLLRVRNELFERTQALHFEIFVYRNIISYEQSAKYMLWLDRKNNLKDPTTASLFRLRQDFEETREEMKSNHMSGGENIDN